MSDFTSANRLTPSYNSLGLSKYFTLPSQTVSWSKKQTDKWQEECMGFFVSAFLSGSYRRQEKRINYKLINGEFDFASYKDSIRPVYANGEYGDVPNELVHYPICNLPLKELWGTETNRPFNFRVKDQSEGATNEFLRAKTDALSQSCFARIAEEFKATKGIDIQSEEGQSQTPQQIQDYFSRKYNTTTEIAGNKILQKVIKELQLKEKFQIGWKDATVVAEEFYWVGTLNNKLYCEVINPLNIVFDKSQDIRYLDEGEWVAHGEYMAPSQIVDRFRDSLTEENVVDIMAYASGEEKSGGATDATGIYSITTGNSLSNDIQLDYNMNTGIDRDSVLDPNEAVYEFSQYGSYNQYINKMRHILVVHGEWMGKRKLATLNFIDEQGMPQKTIIDGDIPLDQDMIDAGWTVEPFWINETYEGTQIGRNLVIDVRPKRNQHYSKTKLGSARLGYTGTIYNNRNAKPTSILDEMKEHNMLYNIVMRKLKEDFNSELGELLLMDPTQIPSKDGWDVEKWLWYIKETKIVFADPTKAKYNTGISTINASLGNSIQQKINMLEFLRNECWLMAGFSPQRLAAVNTNETATATNMALQKSYSQTEDYFRTHNNVKCRVLSLLLEEAKVAYASGLTDMLFLDDLSRDFISIDGEALSWSDLSVYITDSAQDEKVLEQIRSLGQAALQNGASLLDVADMMSTDSVAELKEKLQKIKEAGERMYQQKMEMEQKAMEDQKALEMEKMDREDINKQLDRENKLAVEELSIVGSIQLGTGNIDANENGVPDPVEMAALAMDQSQVSFDMAHKLKEHNFKASEANKKLKLEEKKLNLSEKQMRQDKELTDKETKQQNRMHKDNIEIAKKKLVVDRIKANKPSSSKK